MRILLVEDHQDLAANIGEFLEGRGETVDYAADGLSGLHLAATHPYDVMVLDLGLPGLNGLALCERLRQDLGRPLPVLMLTSRDTERDKLAGFEAGADDYLTKPFSLPELHARLKALARRAAGLGDSVLRILDLEFDTRRLAVRRGGHRIALTPIGLRVLEALMRASPAVVTRADIQHVIWGDSPPEGDASLRGHIHGLRQAIDADHPHKLLHTLHGIGYRLGPEEDG